MKFLRASILILICYFIFSSFFSSFNRIV